MKALDGRRVAVVPGDGVVGRSDHALLLVHGAPDAIDALLVEAPLHSAAGVDRLRRVVAGGLPEGIAGMIVVTPGDGLDVATAGPEHVSVNGVEPPATQHGAASVRVLTVGDEIRLGVPFGRAGSALDLRDGLVPGCGVVVSTSPQPRAHGHHAAPQQQRDPDTAHASPSTRGQSEDDDSAPGRPDEDTERWSALEPSDVGTAARRAEPVRGQLVFDDGMTCTLDRSYVIGRDLPDTGDPSLAALVVDDAEHSVSRRHAEVRLDGWDVVVRDLGSSNGTRVWDPRAGAWQRLETGQPLVLAPGTYVAVGRRVFLFEPPSRE